MVLVGVPWRGDAAELWRGGERMWQKFHLARDAERSERPQLLCLNTGLKFIMDTEDGCHVSAGQ